MDLRKKMANLSLFPVACDCSNVLQEGYEFSIWTTNGNCCGS